MDRIEPITRAEALIPKDVILTRSRSFDTGYRVWDDSTSSEGRYVRVDATRITLISLRLVQRGIEREVLTKFYQMPKVILLKTKSIHIVYLNKKIKTNNQKVSSNICIYQWCKN